MNLGRGTLVDNRYRVVELVGEGSSAQVYLAEAVRDGGGRVALKILRRPGDDTLSNELAILQKLAHPSLVRLLGHGTLSQEGPPYLALEWVDGTDLVEASRLLPPSRLRGLLAQLCRGLAYLHGQGIVHGDLKPSNLLVVRSSDEAEDGLVIKILDFGLARLIDGSDRPEGGTLAYAAPEILRGGKVDGRADLYAVGILLYRILSGSLPFDVSDPAAALRGHLEETPRPLDRDRIGVAAELAEIVTRLLMKDPADRFASATELADRLEDEEASAGDASSNTPSGGLRPPAMVGRDRETRALLEFLDGHPRGKDGHGLALILGEGGIGKTRLLAELGDRARERGLGVHQGSCHETGAEPFGAFLELFRWAVDLAEDRGLRTGKDGEEGEEVGLIERCGPEVVKVVPRAFRNPVEPSAELQPRYERLRLIDTVGTFLLAVSRAEPFLLAIEDLHWTDDASADLLEYLLRNRARGRIALAATARPAENRALWLKDTLQREGGEGSVLRIALERLDEEAVAELARSALALPAPSPELAAHLLRETAGNPFFVMEMLRDLVEEGLLTRRNGTWRWDEERLRRRPRPAGIAQALERRIARTGDRERHVLQALALLDRAVDPELLATVAAAAGSGEEAAPASLAGTEGGERTAATTGGAGAADRATADGSAGTDAADRVSAEGAAGTNAAAFVAAGHGEGTDTTRLAAAAATGSILETAARDGVADAPAADGDSSTTSHGPPRGGSGRRLGERSALEEVLEALTDRGLVVRYGEPPEERFAIAHDAARELVERAVGGEERQRIHRTAGTALEERYGSDGEEQIERMAYHFIQAGDDDRSARYCVRAATKARRLYANEEACYFYLQALKYYTADDDPVRWDALGSLGEIYLVQGKVNQARKRYEEMRQLAEASGNAERLVTAYLGLAESARKLADYQIQMQFARTAFKIAQDSRAIAGQADSLQVLGLGHYNLGRVHKAIKCYSLALDLLRPISDNRITLSILNRLGLAMMSMGDLDRATSLFEEA
ncbi:MAG: protein kinase, partial [Acidobacteriota bacterium]